MTTPTKDTSMEGVIERMAAVSVIGFAASLVTIIPVMAVAHIMPQWWQFVFFGFAIALLGSGALLAITALLHALIPALTSLKEHSNDHE